MNKHYTKKQMEYINAMVSPHITAVEIIGELEADLASMAEREAELDDDQQKTQKKFERLKELIGQAVAPAKNGTRAALTITGELAEAIVTFLDESRPTTSDIYSIKTVDVFICRGCEVPLIITTSGTKRCPICYTLNKILFEEEESEADDE